MPLLIRIDGERREIFQRKDYDEAGAIDVSFPISTVNLNSFKSNSCYMALDRNAKTKAHFENGDKSMTHERSAWLVLSIHSY